MWINRVGLLVGVALISASPAHADVVVTGLSGFTSPSGNIGCMIDPFHVRCDIRERDWSPPPPPSDCPSFTGFGQGLVINSGQPAQFVCAGDTALAGGPPLPYGESITAGLFNCSSTESGMTCRDTWSGHGFWISRQGYQMF